MQRRVQRSESSSSKVAVQSVKVQSDPPQSDPPQSDPPQSVASQSVASQSVASRSVASRSDAPRTRLRAAVLALFMVACVLAAAAWADAQPGARRAAFGADEAPLKTDAQVQDTPAKDAQAQHAEWKDIERAARDGRPETRAWAVRQAAERADEPGWKLVAEALGDPQAVVGDEAVLLHATRADEARLARLAALLSERDPLVRSRLAELYGRAQADVRVAWLGVLARDDDGEVARCALSALLRRVEAGRLAADERDEVAAIARRAFRERDPVLQALAWRLGWRVSPDETEEAVRAALRAPEPARRAAAASSLGACTQVLALELAVPLLEDSAASARAAAIAVLGPLRHRGALRALADRLAREVQPRLRHRLRLELANALGVDRGEDSAAFAADVAAWSGGVATRAAAAEVRPATSAHFSGLPLVSDRVAFLVDLSGSMWSAKVGEWTRKELVDRALAAALRSMPRGARVQLVPYTARPIPWERASVPLDAARLRSALEWFAGRRESGPGDFLEAFESVLADEHIDSVCVLTDGVPTGGERHELGLLFDRLLDRNAPRQLAVDALLVDCRPAIAARWSGFCAATGGVARRVRYEDLLGERDQRGGGAPAREEAGRQPAGRPERRDAVADHDEGE